MGFQVAVVFYSRHGRLAVLANVIAEGARQASLLARENCDLRPCFTPLPCLRPVNLQVPGAEVMVYRVKDPIRHDSEFDEGVLDAPVATTQVHTLTWEPGPSSIYLRHLLKGE